MTGTHQRTPHASTIGALIKAKNEGISWRSLAGRLGYEDTKAAAAVLCGVAKGKPSSISVEGERDLRVRLGLPAGLRRRKRYMLLRCPEEWEDWLNPGEARNLLADYVAAKRANPNVKRFGVTFGVRVVKVEIAEQYKEPNSLSKHVDGDDLTW